MTPNPHGALDLPPARPRIIAGRARWLARPSVVANVPIAACSALYLACVVRELTTASFWLWGSCALAAWLSVSQVLLRRHLSALHSPQTSSAGADQARRFARLAGHHSAAVWALSMLTVAALLRWSAEISWHTFGRLVCAGLLFAPIAFTVVGLLTARRGLLVVEALAAAGAPVPTSRDAPPGRGQTCVRLVLFTVVMVALPSMMLADIAHASTEQLTDLALEAQGTPALVDAQGRLALILVGFCISSLGLALLAAWAGASAIALPLRRVAEEVGALSRGQVGVHTFIAAEGEVGLVTEVFSRLRLRLVAVLGQLHRAGGEIDSATAALRVNARQYEVGSVEQAAALDKTSVTTESLASSAQEISRSASEVQSLAQKTLQAAEAGRTRAEALREAVDRMSQDNALISGAVERLQVRVGEIGSIIELINGVARRNDGLASEAQLQGARIGGVGRSFMMVAAEMRRHAQNTLESTDEVEELIGEIREATKNTAEATQVSAFLTFNSSALAIEVERSLKTVALLARETSNAVSVISLATRQQETGTGDLASAMADILGITQQAMATTQQLTVANEQLRALSMNLSAVVEGLA